MTARPIPSTRSHYRRRDDALARPTPRTTWAIVLMLTRRMAVDAPWRAAGLDPKGEPSYRELGSGMGPALNTAAGLDAYVLSDRATWAAFKNRQQLEILAEGDPTLFNPYGSILVNPAKGAHIKAADARRWHEWLTSDRGRAAIASFRIDGEQLFFPSAVAPRS